MITFLFWNIKKQPLENVVANLAWQHQVDVLLLAECNIPPSVMLETLNQHESLYDYAPDNHAASKIRVFTRFPNELIPHVGPNLNNRWTIRQLQLSPENNILLVVTHLPGRPQWEIKDTGVACRNLAKAIKAAEESVGHTRTLLMGDFNLNPFDHEIISVDSLHAVMSRDIAVKETRIVSGERYPFFYNPMWGRLGDTSPGPPGTYYYDNGKAVLYFWNTFDQVMLRPALLPVFEPENLQVLETDGQQSFLTSGRQPKPDKERVSDHLPILCKLTLDKEF